MPAAVAQPGGAPRVAITRCPIDASDDLVRERVRAAVDLIGGLPESLQRARRIVVKPNWVGTMGRGKRDQDVRMHRGRHAHCTEPAVAAAVVGLLREANPGATIYFGDGLDVDPERSAESVFRLMRADELARRFDVTLLDFNDPGPSGAFAEVPVDDGTIVRSLRVRREIAEADAFVSVAKLKCHQTAGVTLTTKNFFGLIPRAHYGAHNRGFQHQNAFRLMRMFVDINTAFRQSLSILDGIVGTNYGMNGDPYEAGVVLAGTNHVATDAVAMALMGFDPAADFPHPPFMISENHIRLAERRGLGTTDLSEIPVLGEPLASFDFQFETRPHAAYTPEKAAAIVAAARDQARFYLANRDELLRTYQGKWIFLVGGKVVEAADTLAEAATIDFFDDKRGFGFATQVLPGAEQVERIESYVA